MVFRSRPNDSRKDEFSLNARTIACILTPILTVALMPGAHAQSEVPDLPSQPSAQSSQKKVSAGRDANKIGKYDVDHIGERGIGRGFNIYSLKREHELGLSLAASFDSNTKVIADPLVNEYVNRLAQRIAGNSDAVAPFTIKVIDAGDIPRAYGLPGGFLYIASALIISADGEAELAGIIAREIAHVAARHATRALTRKRLWNVAGSMAYLAGPAGVAFEDAGSIAGPLSLKKFMRDSEYEADLLGLEYTYAAGYDPQALLDALEKLHALEVARNASFAKIPGFHLVSKLPFHSSIARSFASYPLTEERIQRLQSEISTFLPNRRDYVLDTADFQEVKASLLASRTPVLHRHSGDNDDNKGPVLRRNVEYSSEIRGLPDSTVTPEVRRNSGSPAADFPQASFR